METNEPADVWLVFPPLVDTNFGSFYPSTAVLAAFLEANGFPTAQDDLNEDFAVWLLDRARRTGGELPQAAPESMPAAAARWLSRSADRLFDDEGRHDFGPDSPYGHVLRLLATAYLVDPDETVLDPVDHGLDVVRAYREFYSDARVGERIPAGASLIGISVPMGPQLLPALVLADLVKAARPDTPVVLGGPALSLMDPADLDRLLTNHPAVDCVVRFDGEFPLLALARQARVGEWHPGDVPGVSFMDGDGTRHLKPGPGPAVNALPAPRYPADAIARLANPVIAVPQARGCYWGKCDYCDFIELYDGSPPFRGRRPDGFVDELAQLVEDFGVRRFTFITESIPPAFARKVCTALLARDLRITWSSFAMVDRRFDRDLLALMKEAGCEFVVVGMETTITRVLKLVHKSSDREENLRFLRDAREVGLPLVVNLIPDLPTTTYEEALTALEDVAEFADSIRSISVFPFEATRSSNVGRDPERFGLVTSESSGDTGQAQYALNHLPNVDPAMTPEQRAEVHRRYRAFADQVNSRDYRDVPLPRQPHETVRFAVAELDVLDVADGLVCTNMRTRQQVTVPARAAGILAPYLDGGAFSRHELAARAGERAADRLLDNLAGAGLLVAERSGV